MKVKILLITLFTLLIISLPVQAQLGGEELPAGVEYDDVYRVSNKMYCDVCAGVPLSSCASVTCKAWRQEIANLLGEGYGDDQIYEYFSVRYGSDVTGVPLEDGEKGLALGLPAILTVVIGVLVVWQVWRMRQREETRAHEAARTAGLNTEYDRPVPDNVDPEGLRIFLQILEDRK